MRPFFRSAVALVTACAVLGGNAQAAAPGADVPAYDPGFSAQAVTASLVGAQWIRAPLYRVSSVAVIALIAEAVARAQTSTMAPPMTIDATWNVDPSNVWIPLGSLLLGFGFRIAPKFVYGHYVSDHETQQRERFFKRLSTGLFSLTLPLGIVTLVTSQALGEIVLPAMLVMLDTTFLMLSAHAGRALRQWKSAYAHRIDQHTLRGWFRAFRTLTVLGLVGFWVFAGTPGNILHEGLNWAIGGVTIVAVPILHMLVFPDVYAERPKIRKGALAAAVAIVLSLIYAWTWLDIPRVRARGAAVAAPPQPRRASLDSRSARIAALSRAA